MSRRRGTRRSVSVSVVSREAHRIGSVEFLLPLTSTAPRSFSPPRIRNRSMGGVSLQYCLARYSWDRSAGDARRLPAFRWYRARGRSPRRRPPLEEGVVGLDRDHRVVVEERVGEDRHDRRVREERGDQDRGAPSRGIGVARERRNLRETLGEAAPVLLGRAPIAVHAGARARRVALANRAKDDLLVERPRGLAEAIHLAPRKAGDEAVAVREAVVEVVDRTRAAAQQIFGALIERRMVGDLRLDRLRADTKPQFALIFGDFDLWQRGERVPRAIGELLRHGQDSAPIFAHPRLARDHDGLERRHEALGQLEVAAHDRPDRVRCFLRLLGRSQRSALRHELGAEALPAEDVEVDVGDGLPAIGSNVGDHAIPPLVHTLRNRNFSRQ